MQNHQEPGALLSSSEQRAKAISTETPKPEPIPKDSRGVFATWDNTSLNTQQIVSASITSTIATLVVLIVIPLAFPDVTRSGDAGFSQLLRMGTVAIIIGVVVGATTWALGQLAIARLNHDLKRLQAQFEAMAPGNLDIRVPVNSCNELGQLATSFNEIARSLHKSLEDAQHQLKEQEKEKENLQHKLSQIVRNIESNSENSLLTQSEGVTSEDDEGDVTPPGTLPDFLDNLQGWTQVTAAPELIVGSSTLDEVRQRKEELEYRQVWLQALQNETQRELTILSLIGQFPDKAKVRETSDG